MKLLWRIVIVLIFSLLGMQGASACEHHHAGSSRVHASTQANDAHCAASTSNQDSCCHRSHSLCCMSACGVHGGALLSNVGESVRVASSDGPFADSDAMRASVTRAPPVRPPIV